MRGLWCSTPKGVVAGAIGRRAVYLQLQNNAQTFLWTKSDSVDSDSLHVSIRSHAEPRWLHFLADAAVFRSASVSNLHDAILGLEVSSGNRRKLIPVFDYFPLNTAGRFSWNDAIPSAKSSELAVLFLIFAISWKAASSPSER